MLRDICTERERDVEYLYIEGEREREREVKRGRMMKEAIIYNHHHIYSKRERETDSGRERERERNIVSGCVRVQEYKSSCIIKGCTFSFGLAYNDGGAVIVDNAPSASSSPLLSSSSFLSCKAEGSKDPGGGGLHLSSVKAGSLISLSIYLL